VLAKEKFWRMVVKKRNNSLQAMPCQDKCASLGEQRISHVGTGSVLILHSLILKPRHLCSFAIDVHAVAFNLESR
jgi:hypothetical protein